MSRTITFGAAIFPQKPPKPWKIVSLYELLGFTFFNYWRPPKGYGGRLRAMAARRLRVKVDLFSINIYALEQLPQYHRIGKKGEETVIFTLTLQNCKEGLVLKALEEINQADYMLKPVVLLRESV